VLLLAASSPRALAGQILKTVWKNTKISIINYYLDSTNYRLTKTKTNKLTQRLAEFSYMHAYHSFQSELCFLPVPYRRPLNRVGTLSACAVCVARRVCLFAV